MNKKSSESARRTLRQKGLLCGVITIICTLIGGGTLAYLVAQSGPVTNVFTPAKVTIDIVETFEENVKSDIRVQNTSEDDIPVYVRVNLLCYWSEWNEDGSVSNPVGTNGWSLPANIELGSNWFKGNDNFYYYSRPLKKDETTFSLFTNSITLKEMTEDEKEFAQTLDILAQAIQAEPAEAVEGTWPVEVGSSGVLTAKSSF